MEKVLEILNQIDTGDVGIVIYSNLKKKVVFSSNEQLIVPLASAGKVGIAYCIAKMVEDGHVSWTDSVDDIVFDSKEDSKELYPHFQNRISLTLSEAVEVMIACHDNVIAKRIVQYCGGWEYISDRLSFYFEMITIKENPRDKGNEGEIKQIFELLLSIYNGYEVNPEIYAPIMNGFVRQRGAFEGETSHLINHMTGGLETVIVNIGIIGEFKKDPLLYVIGAKDLPNRFNHSLIDELVTKIITQLLIEKVEV